MKTSIIPDVLHICVYCENGLASDAEPMCRRCAELGMIHLPDLDPIPPAFQWKASGVWLGAFWAGMCLVGGLLILAGLVWAWRHV